MFEVELKIRVDAKTKAGRCSCWKLAYAGAFRLTNVPDTGTQQLILLIQAPHMLFPFVRRIVADVVRDGGMPPLMIEPIDFMALYQARWRKRRPAPAAARQRLIRHSKYSCPQAPWRQRRRGFPIPPTVIRAPASPGAGARPAPPRPCGGGDLDRRQHQAALPPADQFQIDFRRQLGVQQRAMQVRTDRSTPKRLHNSSRE
jgi:hypothetical protein